MSDVLLRRVTEGRAGAEAPDDYDVNGDDGRVIGRIFKTAIPRTGTSLVWRVTDREARTRATSWTREAAMQAFLGGACPALNISDFLCREPSRRPHLMSSWRPLHPH